MSAIACPACKQKGFVWNLNDGKPPKTTWNCANCSYAATEDESKETDCPNCNGSKMLMELKDDKRIYQYCSRCLYSKEIGVI